MMLPAPIAVGSIAVIAAIALGEVHGRNACAAKVAAVAAAAAMQKDRYEQEAGTLEEELAQLRAGQSAENTVVERLVERPVYRNVCFDVDGLRAANRAITGAAPSPDAKVPAPHTP